MRKTIHIVKGALTSEDILGLQSIVESKYKMIEETMHTPSYLPDSAEYQGKYRSCSLAFISSMDIPVVWDKVLSQAFEANRHVFGFDTYGTETDTCQFTVYDYKKSGYFKWHQDTHFEPERAFSDRKLSISVQLSDPSEYEGGELQFMTVNSEVPIEEFNGKGDIIIFPSFLMHRVSPITRGVRKSLVFWIDGPALR